MSSSLLLLLFSLILLTITTTTTAQQHTFTCTTPNNCTSIIEYVSPNTTTLSSIQRLFSIPNHRTLLGANNLNLSTPNTTTISAGQTVRIPFPCTCTNNTGISNRRPFYTVLPNDTLYHIAAQVFSNLVTFQQIQDVNGIVNADLIQVGQRLWIPLPCSCDEVDGESVVHYGYVVESGNSIDGIAERFNVSRETIMRLNNLTGPNLFAGAVLDVPLRACSSMINNSSRDYPLLVPNGTYVFTANNCVRCSCDAANNWMLQCEPFQFNSRCSPIRCEGPDNLFLGNTTSSGCNRTTCAYAGYNPTNITTALSVESTCPASNNGSFGIRFQWWNSLLITIHVMLLCVSFFN